MPVHDWTRVEAGIFHAFHLAWTAALQNVLNEGLLPQGYYALAEQHAGRSIPDVLTLHVSPDLGEPSWSPPDSGGIAVAEAPPRVQHKQIIEPTSLSRRRSLAIRHVSGHRLIALIEIVPPVPASPRCRCFCVPIGTSTYRSSRPIRPPIGACQSSCARFSKDDHRWPCDRPTGLLPKNW